MKHAKKKSYKKIALVLSLCLIIVWAVLGTSTSLAWFNDTTPELKNVINFAEFDLAVSHRLPDGSYETIEQHTDLFDDEALYEPGYVQVVVLKIENLGTVAFDFEAAVTVLGYTPGINVYGNPFKLQDHLLFGLVTADTEAELDALVATREQAMVLANEPLSQYYTTPAELAAKDDTYMALIVRMPEPVGNVANHLTGTAPPTVELGISVTANQQR